MVTGGIHVRHAVADLHSFNVRSPGHKSKKVGAPKAATVHSNNNLLQGPLQCCMMKELEDEIKNANFSDAKSHSKVALVLTDS